jgi:hypothetical protein
VRTSPAIIAGVALAALAAGPSPARGQSVDVEIFGGLALSFPSLDTVYDASYTPSRVIGINQLFETPDPRSRAQQSLSLQGSTGVGLGVGLNLYPHDSLGFQFLFDRARSNVGGENPPHQVELTYDSIAFPQPDPVVRNQSFTFDSSDTDGSLSQTSFSFNAAARFGRGDVRASVSGGLTYYRFRLEAERIGAHAAWLGGHAVLFSELYEVSIETPNADAFGFNVGGAVDVSLGPGLSLFTDARWFEAPETAVGVELSELLSTNVVSVPRSQIQTFLALPSIEVDPGFFRILFGVKWRI